MWLENIINESKVDFSKDQINRVIEEVLRCNICYNIFQNPVSVKGCLHKFCKACISDYYFKVKKAADNSINFLFPVTN